MKKNKSFLLSGPYIVWMVIFTLIPLGVVAYYAFTDPNTGAFSMKNILELQNYLPVLWQSVLYSLISALICLVLGYPVAYYIAHQGVEDGLPQHRAVVGQLLDIPKGEHTGIRVGEGIVSHHTQRDQGEDHHEQNIRTAEQERFILLHLPGPPSARHTRQSRSYSRQTYRSTHSFS